MCVRVRACVGDMHNDARYYKKILVCLLALISETSEPISKNIFALYKRVLLLSA